jgi:hypothetical protein
MFRATGRGGYGSQIKIYTTFTREIEKVRLFSNDTVIINTNGVSVYLGEFKITNDTKLSFNCVDRLGLTAKSPFVIDILAAKDSHRLLNYRIRRYKWLSLKMS